LENRIDELEEFLRAANWKVAHLESVLRTFGLLEVRAEPTTIYTTSIPVWATEGHEWGDNNTEVI
jgi:hypothetical protein